MTSDELLQIGTAITKSLTTYVHGRGTMVTLDAVLAILSSHCADAELTFKDDVNMPSMAFTRPRAK